MIQLIVSDMDGTLLNDELAISDVNRDAIHAAKKAGIDFMIATGRGYAGALPALTEAGIRCPVISVNGGQIFDEDGQLDGNIGIDKQRTQKILEAASEQGLYADVVTSDGIYSISKMKRVDMMSSVMQFKNAPMSYKTALVLTLARLEEIQINYINDFEDILNDESVQILKVLVFSNFGQKELQPIRNQFEKDNQLNVTSSFFNNIEINHHQAQKGIALERFIKSRNIPMEKVMAIGDNFNDVSMLKKAGVSFAMGNAEPEVKEYAKYVTTLNTDHGVAAAIRRCIDEGL